MMDHDYRKAANLTVIFAGSALFFWIFLKYVFGATVPFLLGFVIAAVISRPANIIARKTKLSVKAVAAILVFLLFASVSAIVYLATSRLINEVGNLIDRLSSNPETIGNLFEMLTERFSFLQKITSAEAIQQLGIDIDRLLNNTLNSLMSSLSGSLPSAAANLATLIPEALLFVAILLISAFYFSTDSKAISKALVSLLPDKWQEKLPQIKTTVVKTLKGYIKAYFTIMLLTFFEVFIGLSILNVSYAFLLSLIIAVVDILPILGTGTVLVPWAIFSFVTSDSRLGMGLLILYAVISVVRQIAEPKIVGNTLGLHPLAALASVYFGIKLIGFSGIFIGPVAALLLKSFFKPENVSLNNAPSSSKVPRR